MYALTHIRGVSAVKGLGLGMAREGGGVINVGTEPVFSPKAGL